MIPTYLSEADKALTAYGRWAKDRPSYGRCGSAEGRYRSTDVHHGATAPVVLIADWSAAEVQASLNRLPEKTRYLLTAWYVPGHGQQRRLRKARRGTKPDRFTELLIEALQAFNREHFDTRPNDLARTRPAGSSIRSP